MRLPDYFKDYVFDQFVTVDEDGVATPNEIEDNAPLSIPYKKVKEWIVDGLLPGDTSSFLKTLLFALVNLANVDLLELLYCLYVEMGEEDFTDEMREHFKKRIKRLKNDPMQEVSSTIDGSARAITENIVGLIASKKIRIEESD